MPDYGTSWDEPVRWGGGDRKLDYYSALLGLSEDEGATNVRRDLYPGFFDMNLAWVRRVSPLSDWATSRVFNTVFGLLGVLGAALLAESLRKGAGRWAALFLLLYPGWFGHMFINPKDVPFASMYVLSLWALGGFILADSRKSSWTCLIRFSVLAGLTAATRVPGLVLFAYLGFAMIAQVVAGALRAKVPASMAVRRLGVEALRGCLAVLIGFVVLLPWWPYLHGNPIARTVEAVSGVAAFDWTFPVLFWGEHVPAQELPFSYLPTWLLMTTPFVFFVVAGLAALQFRTWLGAPHPEGARDRRSILVAVIVIAVVFPVIFIILSKATVYNGLRHILFVIPPALALLAVGWSRSETQGWASHSLHRRWIARALLAVGFAPVVFAMVHLHPYQYTYFNVIAGGVRNAGTQFETEYWGTSYKEAAEKLIEWLDELGATGDVVVNMEHPTWLLTHHLPDDRPYRVHVVRSQGEFAHVYISNTVWHSHTWWAGEVVATVERAGAVFCVIKDRRHLQGEERKMYYGLE